MAKNVSSTVKGRASSTLTGQGSDNSWPRMKVTRKGTTHGPEEYYSHPWPGPEVLGVYFQAGLWTGSNHYFLVRSLKDTKAILKVVLILILFLFISGMDSSVRLLSIPATILDILLSRLLNHNIRTWTS